MQEDFSSTAMRTSNLVLSYLYIAVYVGLLRVCTFPVAWYSESYKTFRRPVKGCVGTLELGLISVHNCLSRDSQQLFLPSYPFTVGREHSFPAKSCYFAGMRPWAEVQKLCNFNCSVLTSEPLRMESYLFIHLNPFVMIFIYEPLRAPNVCFRHWQKLECICAAVLLLDANAEVTRFRMNFRSILTLRT